MTRLRSNQKGTPRNKIQRSQHAIRERGERISEDTLDSERTRVRADCSSGARQRKTAHRKRTGRSDITGYSRMGWNALAGDLGPGINRRLRRSGPSRAHVGTSASRLSAYVARLRIFNDVAAVRLNLTRHLTGRRDRPRRSTPKGESSRKKHCWRSLHVSSIPTSSGTSRHPYSSRNDSDVGYPAHPYAYGVSRAPDLDHRDSETRSGLSNATTACAISIPTTRAPASVKWQSSQKYSDCPSIFAARST